MRSTERRPGDARRGTGIGQITRLAGGDQPATARGGRGRATRSSATSSRRPGSASPRSSTRSACTASWPGTRRASSSRSGRPRALDSGRWSRRWPRRSGGGCWRPAPATRWRRSSTSRATRAGAGSRRPTARTRTSRPSSAAPTSAASRAPTSTDGVVATGKHMVGHGLAEGGLNQAPAHIGPARAARRAAVPVRGGGPRVGPGERHARLLRRGRRALPRVDRAADRRSCAASGASTASSPPTTSAIEMLATPHRLTADLGDGGARWRSCAGVDAELPQHGRVRRAAARPPSRTAASTRPLLDAAVARILRMKFRLGLFERPYVDVPDAATLDDARRRRGAGRAGRSPGGRSCSSRTTGSCRSRPDRRRVAVIGPIADSARDLLGDYSHLRPHRDAARDAQRRERARRSPSTARHRAGRRAGRARRRSSTRSRSRSPAPRSGPRRAAPGSATGRTTRSPRRSRPRARRRRRDRRARRAVRPDRRLDDRRVPRPARPRLPRPPAGAARGGRRDRARRSSSWS